MGAHSKPNRAKKILKRTSAAAAIAGAAVGAISLGTGTADAFPGQAGLVACESGGNPAIVNNTAAGRAAGRPGGLFQIVTGTWLAYGGGQFAPTADKATPGQQQIVADRIYAAQGAAPWECKPGPGPAQFSYFPPGAGVVAAVAVTSAGSTSSPTAAAAVVTSTAPVTKPAPVKTSVPAQAPKTAPASSPAKAHAKTPYRHPKAPVKASVKHTGNHGSHYQGHSGGHSGHHGSH